MRKYDEVRADAIFKNGERISNDKINVRGLSDEQIAEAVKEEIEITRKWWNDEAIYYIVTYYRNGEAIAEERIE